MTHSPRRLHRIAEVVAIGGIALCACRGHGEPAHAPAAQVPAGVASNGPNGGIPISFGIDPKSLRFEGPANTVLVRSKGRPFITAEEYNNWLGTYPLNITSQDPTEATGQALEQMAMFKLLTNRARQAGYENKIRSTGGVPDERSIVLMFVRDQISNIASVTDEAVREFERQHPERFPKGEGQMPAEMRDVAVKGEIRGLQLTEEIRTWMDQESLTFEKKKG